MPKLFTLSYITKKHKTIKDKILINNISQDRMLDISKFNYF